LPKPIIMGSDPWAWDLHRNLAERLSAAGHSVTEVNEPGGDRVPYYEVSKRVALAMHREPHAVGIMLCGTGMGVAMAANRFPGISCALCETTLAAHRARIFNNANALAMGQYFTTPYVAWEIVQTFLNTEFGEGVEKARTNEILTWHRAVSEMEQRLFVDDWQEKA
jgi:ribose 5-phosphate isomerase B